MSRYWNNTCGDVTVVMFGVAGIRHKSVCFCAFVCVFYVCMYACLCVLCVCVCLIVCVCVFVYIYMCVCMHELVIMKQFRIIGGRQSLI